MSTWSNIKTVMKRELGGYFNSPVAYVFIVIFLLMVGVFTFTFGFFFERQQASLKDSFFFWHPWLYLFLVPAVAMRLWSEERRQGTLELLLTMPITAWQAIVGKFLASWIFLGLALFLTFPIVVTVNSLGDPDNGAILCGYFGSFLLAGAYLAVGCLTSAMTRNQVISFIVSVVVCFAFIALGWDRVTDSLAQILPAGAIRVVSSFSVLPHFDGFQRGVLDLRDILFFGSIIGFALFATGVVLRNLRSGH
jgi:ABC-2 type transport system permease protein